MKKRFIIILLAVLCVLSSCSLNAQKEPENTSPSSVQQESEKEKATMEDANRALIASALGIDENARQLRFILSGLETVGAGNIQKAEAAEEDGEQVLDIVAENGVSYRIYLTASGGLNGIKRQDTGEWVITS